MPFWLYFTDIRAQATSFWREWFESFQFVFVDWQTEIHFAIKVGIAALLGALIGLEREARGSEAGIRTYAAVCLGSCTFGLISAATSGPDPTRIAAQVVSGMGFLGAGVILRDKARIRGLTTAATLWATAALGLAVAYGMFLLAGINTVIITILLFSSRLKKSEEDKPEEEIKKLDD